MNQDKPLENPWEPEFKLKGLRKMDEEEMHKTIDSFEAWFDLKYANFERRGNV